MLIVGSIVYIEYTKPSISPSQIKSVGISSSQNASSTTATSTGISSAVYAAIEQIAQQDNQAGDSPAVELVDPTGFINTQPFTLSSLVGKKVILLDFWTYSCINCVRTIPYLEAWYQKYSPYGLVIVGIHTPEFDFEKDISNVQTAVQKYGITYPVVLDSNMGTWDAYQNEYWPADYLINIAGYIVDKQFGEGNYAETESAIQSALEQRAQVYGLPNNIPTGTVSPSSTINVNFSGITTEETYFGANRNEFLANGNQNTTGTQTLTIPGSGITQDALYLGGTWDFEPQFAENQDASGDKILLEYGAKNVYMVAGSAQGVTIKVLMDGKPLGSDAGSDVSPTSSTAFIKAERLYNLIQNSSYGEHTIEIDIEGSGLQAYTFTFG